MLQENSDRDKTEHTQKKEESVKASVFENNNARKEKYRERKKYLWGLLFCCFLTLCLCNE